MEPVSKKAEFLEKIRKEIVPKVEKTGRLNVDTFLAQTEGEIREAERLRLLAIELESLGVEIESQEIPGWSYVMHWSLVSGLYEEAIRREPDHLAHYDSFVVSAIGFVQLYASSLVDFITREVREIVEDQLASNRQNPHPNYVLGRYAYALDLPESLTHFQNAIDKDPEHYMAKLFMGYVLFDQDNWQAARKVFLDIDGAILEKEWPSWREVRRQELVAAAYVREGELEKAQPYFDQMMEYYQQKKSNNPPRILLAAYKSKEENEIVRQLQKVIMDIDEYEG